MTKRANRRPLVYKTPQSKLDMPAYISSLVNPFDPKAKGSKIHDANSSRTFCFQSREIKTLGTNSVGGSAAQIFPFLNDNMISSNKATTDIGATGVVSGSPAFVTTDVPEFTDLANVASQFRIVSWGIRVTCEESAMDAKGRLFIMEHPSVTMQTGANLSRLTDNYILLPVTHDMDYTVIPNHVNDTYQEFLQTDATQTTYTAILEQALPWRSVLFLGLGMAPSTNLNLEIVYNLELIPKIGGIGMRLSTPAAPHSNEVLERVHNTRNKAPLAHPSKSLWQKVKSFAKDSLMAVGDYALDRLTGGVSGYIENAARKFVPRPGQLFLTNG